MKQFAIAVVATTTSVALQSRKIEKKKPNDEVHLRAELPVIRDGKLLRDNEVATAIICNQMLQ